MLSQIEVDKARLSAILYNIEDIFTGKDDTLATLVNLTEPYRDVAELEGFFWWIDFACSEGYDAAEQFFNEMHTGLGKAITFFTGQHKQQLI
jgi:hypothetical protein